MKKIDWLIVLLAVPLVWAIDAYTKSFALKHITGVTFWGPIGLVLHKNPGAMFGMFSDLPPILRVVSLSTGGAFLFFIYAFAQYLLPKRLFSLRIGLSFLLGGILGNVTDRVLWGEVVDFLLIGTPRYSTPAFNFADAIQWVGYLLVVISLLKQGRAFWPDDNERKKVWVHPKFQFKYIFVLIIIGLSFSIISGVFTYTYLKITIDDLAPINSLYFEKKFIPPFLITFAIISLFFLIALFI
ncbi:MAG: signal peptidase II, partial [Bdellovibrio sp.]